MSHQLHHLLAHAATERPDHRAVIDGDASITYGDLERSAAGLAATLRAMGVRPGDRVGLFLPKSIPSIVGIFGILKAGGVYVPIDPLAPATRAALIVGDCGIRCLITTADRLGQLTEAVPKGALSGAVLTDGPAVAAFGMPTRAWAEAVDAPALQMEHDGVETDLGYILYTSGSTGIPKGVMISHRAALTFIEWTCERFRMSGDDVVSSHAPLHFDLSIFDVFTTIKAGGTIVLVPDRLSTFPIKLTQLIRDAGITVWYSVPSALVLMLTRGKFAETALPTLRTILFAGEVFPMKYLRELRAATHAQLFNLYGPTETNVCTYYQVNDLPQHWTAIPIGTAISNYDVFALDDRGRRIGAGDVGELFARGPGLMSGYWGDVEKTDQVLVENPLPGPFAERVCRTGDLVTLDGDGQYLYLGRRDHMVKIRGYRVELGEVEAALYEHPDVHEAAAYVVADAEGTTHLFASVVMSEGQAMTSKDLQTFCAGRLPKYMVPETIDLERALPKTSTGKVDRPALVAARESDGAPAARRA